MPKVAEPVKIEVDLAMMFICKCGYALEPTSIHGVARHPDRTAGLGLEIKCEYAGKQFKIPWTTLEEYLP